MRLTVNHEGKDVPPNIVGRKSQKGRSELLFLVIVMQKTRRAFRRSRAPDQFDGPHRFRLTTTPTTH